MKLATRCTLNILCAVVLFFAWQQGCGAQESTETVVLKGISFVSRSAALEAGSDAALEKLHKELLADPSLAIVIQCTVSPSGDPQQDAKLGRDRAKTLRRWLMRRGVASFRLEIADAQTASSRSGLPAGDRIEIVRVQKSFPVAKVPLRVFRFGPVADGQEVLHDFLLRNKGDAPLNISKVRTG